MEVLICDRCTCGTVRLRSGTKKTNTIKQHYNDGDKMENSQKKRVLVIMCLHVSMEVTRLGESEITDLTTVGFFPTVNSFVLGESRGVSKSLAAVVAAVWPFSGMSAKMSGHRRALREPLVANWATKRLFTAVGS